MPAKPSKAKPTAKSSSAAKPSSMKKAPAKVMTTKGAGAPKAAAQVASKGKKGLAPAVLAKGAVAAPAAVAKKAIPPMPAPAAKAGKAASGKKGKHAPTSGASAAAALAKVRPGIQSAADLAAAAAGESVCREVACEGLATTAGYCRLHYIKNWKKIKRKELILKEKKLNQYIEELVAKYPDKYIEAIRQDLASDKDFAKVISDLDLDEGIDDFDVEQEGVESVIDSIKRDFEDEGDGF